MYATRKEDHEKRKNQEGSYSLYNYIYHYLLDNFESTMDIGPAHSLLYREAKAYCLKGGKQVSDDEIKATVKQAIAAFKNNNGEHGDTGDNLGKVHSDQFATIRDSISDLRW